MEVWHTAQETSGFTPFYSLSTFAVTFWWPYACVICQGLLSQWRDSSGLICSLEGPVFVNLCLAHLHTGVQIVSYLATLI